MGDVAEVAVRPRREHPAPRPPLPLRPDEQLADRGVEPLLVRQVPGRPARMVGIGRVTDERVKRAGQTARSTSSFLVSAIALAGLRPLGQTFAQFMIVWQR